MARNIGIDARKLRDESVEFELESNLDETEYSGSVSNDRGESFSFDVEILADNGRIVDFVAVSPTTRVEGHFEIGADGCGNGTLHIEENGNTADIELSFCENELSDDEGNSLSL